MNDTLPQEIAELTVGMHPTFRAEFVSRVLAYARDERARGIEEAAKALDRLHVEFKDAMGGPGIALATLHLRTLSSAPPSPGEREATDEPRNGQVVGVYMTVCRSSMYPGRLSARTAQGRSLRVALEALGAKEGDEIVVSLAAPSRSEGTPTERLATFIDRAGMRVELAPPAPSSPQTTPAPDDTTRTGESEPDGYAAPLVFRSTKTVEAVRWNGEMYPPHWKWLSAIERDAPTPAEAKPGDWIVWTRDERGRPYLLAIDDFAFRSAYQPVAPDETPRCADEWNRKLQRLHVSCCPGGAWTWNGNVATCPGCRTAVTVHGPPPAPAPQTTPAPGCKTCNDRGAVVDESWGVHRIRTCRDCAAPAGTTEGER